MIRHLFKIFATGWRVLNRGGWWGGGAYNSPVMITLKSKSELPCWICIIFLQFKTNCNNGISAKKTHLFSIQTSESMRLITASFKSLLETVSSKSLTKFETGKWWYIYKEKAKTKTINNKQNNNLVSAFQTTSLFPHGKCWNKSKTQQKLWSHRIKWTQIFKELYLHSFQNRMIWKPSRVEELIKKNFLRK